MTVAELIDALKSCPPTAVVKMQTDGAGHSEVRFVLEYAFVARTSYILLSGD